MTDLIDQHSYNLIKQTSSLKELFYVIFVYNDSTFQSYDIRYYLCFLHFLDGGKNLGNLYFGKGIFPSKMVVCMQLSVKHTNRS